MIFESMWPLALLFSIPVVILLYLLIPKGKDKEISSHMLWQKLFYNQQSKTFFEKFIKNILMYLQILILLLMILALMSPTVLGRGVKKGQVLIILDGSGSMKMDTSEGSSRFDEAKAQIRSLIAASEDTTFSILMNDCTKTQMAAIGVSDKQLLYRTLDGLTCSDGKGNLLDAKNVADTLCGEETTEVLVYTDGSGAKEAKDLQESLDAGIMVVGEPVSNVANRFLSYSDWEDGSVACAGSLINYSDNEAELDISLYDGEKLIQVKSVRLKPDETKLVLFDAFDWSKNPLRTQISNVHFVGEEKGDALSSDDMAYAVLEKEADFDAVFVGEKNTYIEKAYLAATGSPLTKVKEVSEAGDRNIVILDAMQNEDASTGMKNLFLFGSSRNKNGEEKNVTLSFSQSDITAGIEKAVIGVNETNTFEIPKGATGFLWAGEACAGYYGENEGKKYVVLGFDIRESDFPIKAEFPVFMTNALGFLGDASLMAKDTYEAGEMLLFHPQADFDVTTLLKDTRESGLFLAEAKERKEHYVVRFATAFESDGRIQSEGSQVESSLQGQLIRKKLRNVILVLVLLLLVAEWVIYVRQMRYKGRFYYAVRVLGIVLLLMALFGVAIDKRDAKNTTVFLVDISNSNAGHLEEMEQFVKKAIQEMPGKNQYGIVTFGRNALVEQFLTSEASFLEIMSLPDKTATCFEDAISRALAMIPSNGAGRIVVLTDAKETKGDVFATAAALEAREIELLALTYPSIQGQDVYLDKVELPSYLYKGDAYYMTVTVASNYDTPARLEVWEDGVKTDCYDVSLNRGTNSFRFQRTVRKETAENFEVRVIAGGDTCEENNTFHAYATVDSVPKVLLVSGMQEKSSNFKSVLEACGCNYTQVPAKNAPDTLGELLEYKSIFLDNVYLYDLPQGFLEQVETYVKDYGCGLVACGGEQSFALGGYRDSILETMLPVNMELKGMNQIPSMAMVMVIDHSGSMCTPAGTGNDATNLDLAITAAKAAVDQLRSDDYVGIVTFDDQYHWVVPPTKASDKEEIKQKIETITEGGGTTIKPALASAYKEIMKCEVGVRHVVLLTDGQGETTNFNDVIKHYTDSSVTLSTVAVGDGSDRSLMEHLARSCHGRYYYSDESTDIPRIFAQEVYLGGDSFIQNGSFGLKVLGGHELTRGLFLNGWPNILGYICASPKSHASEIIVSEKEDPILTVMQYGLGHTVAWNTDVSSQWTAPYAGEEDYVQLWKRILDYSVGNNTLGDDTVDVVTADGKTVVSYVAKDYGEDTTVEAVYTDPKGNTETLTLGMAAPGRYEGTLETNVSGVYQLRVHRKDEDEITNAMTTAALVQYSDEYRFDAKTTAFQQFVEQYGRQISPEDDFWKLRKSRAKKKYELTNWLLVLLIVWFVVDIAFRRFCFVPFLSFPSRKKEEQVKDAVKTKQGQTDAAVQKKTEEKTMETGETKKVRKKRETKKKEKEDAALDTSALLKKKDKRM